MFILTPNAVDSNVSKPSRDDAVIGLVESIMLKEKIVHLSQSKLQN
jgi:hypothetical protein